MKRSPALVIAVAMILLIGAAAFAGDRDAVAVKELNAGYEAPEVVNKVKPERVFYMPGREIEGYVTLEMTVNEEGRVESARVLYKTSNLAVRNAVNAAEKWEFAPGKLNGRPVKSIVAYSLPFGPDLEILKEKDIVDRVVIDDTTLALLKK